MDTQPETSIIVLTYNNLEHTRACLESVYANTSSFELIVVDNASQDGTPQFLQEFGRGRSNFRYMLNQNNEGFSRGNNQGAALAQGEYLVFLNNDTLVTPGWLPALLAHLGDPVVGMVGPVTNSAANQSRIRVEYPDLAEKPAFTEMSAYAHAYTQAHAGQAFEIEMLAFFCVGMRK